MNIEQRIMFLDNGSPCIFFPVGKKEDGGTCDYMTTECFENCPSAGVVHPHEIRALKYFYDSVEIDIVARIKKELIFFESTHLGWFSWGDCPTELTEKIARIILMLHSAGITQVGFTRNEKLWNILPRKKDLCFSYSVDSFKEAVDKSTDKMVCFPDTDTAEARFFFKGKVIGRCSGYFCTHIDGFKKEVKEADCVNCYETQKGCFSKV